MLPSAVVALAARQSSERLSKAMALNDVLRGANRIGLDGDLSLREN